ncbi:MAG: hypothetical protein J3R72DRAFT_487179 [Linnemannia gamsii]|nr:MAG: hypothetical protein J3R72DRAFT_487179 [Linnemannia gamsii]
MRATFLAPALLLSLLTTAIVHAGPYTLSTPTAATRWTPGQPGLITILSTDKADADTKPIDRLLTITLCLATGGILNRSTQVAVIQSGVQLLVPFKSAETQVKLEISNWVVPATAAAGDKYFVRAEMAKDGFFDFFPEKVKSPYFQVVAAPVNPPTVPPPSGTTGSVVPTPTTNTTLPTPTTPTLPPGQTCEDVKAQCAAQNRTFFDSDGTAVCQCGAAIIMPIIRDSAAVGGFESRQCQHGLLAIAGAVTVVSMLMSSTLSLL